MLARACDMGAEGVMLPMVASADEAKKILESMKYYPEGGRGVALQVAHDDYRPGPVPQKLAAANKRTTFFAQIETADGVKNADAIAAVDGVDCLWVGHFDLWQNDGMVMFRHALVLTGGVEASGEQCRSVLTTALEACERYFPAFQFVLWAGKPAREALDAALFETSGEA